MSKTSAYFTLKDLHSGHDARKIKQELSRLPGVLSVSISEDSHCAAVDYDTTGVQAGRIQKELESLGFRPSDSRVKNHVM